MKKTNMRSYTPKQRLFTRRNVLIILAVLLVIAAIIAALELTHTTHFFIHEKAVSGTIKSTPAKAKSSSNKDKDTTVPTSGASSSPEDPKQGDAATQPAPSGAAPIAPYGNFISNHSPNLGGSPAPSSEQSVCNTTPGATCYISFTNPQGVTKKLAEQKTDTNGSVYWNWDVKQAGFTAGTWVVKVVATLNGQTSTAQDVQNMEVKP